MSLDFGTSYAGDKKKTRKTPARSLIKVIDGVVNWNEEKADLFDQYLVRPLMCYVAWKMSPGDKSKGPDPIVWGMIIAVSVMNFLSAISGSGKKALKDCSSSDHKKLLNGCRGTLDVIDGLLRGLSSGTLVGAGVLQILESEHDNVDANFPYADTVLCCSFVLQCTADFVKNFVNLSSKDKGWGEIILLGGENLATALMALGANANIDGLWNKQAASYGSYAFLAGAAARMYRPLFIKPNIGDKSRIKFEELILRDGREEYGKVDDEVEQIDSSKFAQGLIRKKEDLRDGVFDDNEESDDDKDSKESNETTSLVNK